MPNVENAERPYVRSNGELPNVLYNIYLRFITEKWNPISAAIRFETRSWASHVELIKVNFYPFFVSDVIGCRFSKGLAHYPYLTKWVTREEWYTAPHLDMAWDWMENHVGQKYDLSAIFGIALDGDFHNDNRDICSESIMRASESTPDPILNPLGTRTWRVTPRDLLLSTKIKMARRVR